MNDGHACVVGLQRIHVAGVFSQAGKHIPSDLQMNMGGGTPVV
jgi:hypothetical protein